MTVQELITHLQQFNPETEVFTSITDPTDYTLTLSLDSESMELQDELFGSNVFDSYEDKFDKECEYIGKPVLIINLEF
jgi:hypothetical protein